MNSADFKNFKSVDKPILEHSFECSFESSYENTIYQDGQPINLIKLSNSNNVVITLMDIGATWLRCQIPTPNSNFNPNNSDNSLRDVVLFAKNSTEQLKQRAYMGQIIGPYANRIKGGNYTLNGRLFQVEPNLGENALHGGLNGISFARWNIKSVTANQVIFGLKTAVIGFTETEIEVSYTLTDNNSIIIDYSAISEEDTFLNLSNHAYFNLAGIDSNNSALDHIFEFDSEYYLEVDKQLIPTGQRCLVKDTDLDFKRAKNLLHSLDHTFIFTRQPASNKIVVMSPDKFVILTIKTTKPSFQFFTGDNLAHVLGPYGYYAPRHGFAIEPQFFPDGPNHPEWIGNNGLLLAGNHYRHQTEYQFTFGDFTLSV